MGMARLEVMKYLATIEMTRHWERFPDAFTLGGYHEGGLGWNRVSTESTYHGQQNAQTVTRSREVVREVMVEV
eukprot:6462682-Amphidinium_carterae.1